ncbi:DUF581 domain-containing protein [Quillaja saponaria]|uniref:DUF581 domain-containing protein n=1 Tax=Quillaja saponaria TaxID=32244 RepID=A0AAD7LID8_QUISA|nr:DUF581 domain-containing protein [Quillaja saponaria]
MCFRIMLRKRTRSAQKDQHQMGRLTMSDANSEYCSQSDACGHNHKSNSFFSVTGLFIGLSPKGLSDSDSVRSPTSPLDFRVLWNLGNPVRTPKAVLHDGHQKSWDCSKVGLSIIDSLEDCSEFSGKVLRPSESKNIIFSPRMRIKTPNCQTQRDSFEASKSLQKNYSILIHAQKKASLYKDEGNVIFEIGETHLEPEPFGKVRSCSLDSCSPFSALTGSIYSNPDSDSGKFGLKDATTQVSSPPHFIGGRPNSNKLAPVESNSNPVSLSSSHGFIGSVSASEVELSEDYTCVISHGPDPKKTHIFGGCILGCQSNDLSNLSKNEEKGVGVPQEAKKDVGVRQEANSFENSNFTQYFSNGFLSFCYNCNKKLEEGKDIYIYRGEKSFCSLTCRALEIMVDEELEKSKKSSDDLLKADDGRWGGTF